MNIFRIFFVSTVLIPVLVIAVTSDESGLRIRKPRSVVISEDGTRAARRHSPVNITDKSCPSLGCTGNLTTNAYNGKGSVAATLSPRKTEDASVFNERRFDSPTAETTSAFHHHHRPLKLEIKSIKNSTRSDSLTDYIVSQDSSSEVGTGRSGVISLAVVVSWVVYWTWKAFLSIIVYNIVRYWFGLAKKKSGVGDDYMEYYVKFGKDEKHPFGNYGSGWNPTFGISLKSKLVDEHDNGGWKPSHGWNGWPHHASSYHHSQAQWPPNYYPGVHNYGWPTEPHGWKAKTESEEEEDELRDKFDRKKGWKIAQKYAKKYGKKAHKYGLRPSKYSQFFDKDGNIDLDRDHVSSYTYRRRSSNKKSNRKRLKAVKDEIEAVKEQIVAVAKESQIEGRANTNAGENDAPEPEPQQELKIEGRANSNANNAPETESKSEPENSTQSESKLQ